MGIRNIASQSSPAVRGIVALATVAALAVRADAQIAFENVAPPGGVLNVSPTTPYVEAGFRFTPTNSLSAIFDSASPAGLSGNGTDFFGFEETNTIMLQRVAGGTFDLAGLEIGRTNIAILPTVTFTVIGIPQAGQPMTATFTNVSAFTPVTLNWTNLIQVTFNATDDAGFDNVNTVVVPEPSSLALAMAGMLAAGRALRRASKNASAKRR